MLIGSLASATGVSAKTLRFWEARGLLHEPARTAGGYRDYPDRVVDRVAFIRRAQDAGLTLRHIGEVLAIHDDGDAPCRHAAALVEQRLADVTRRLTDLRDTHAALRRLQQRLAALDPAECATAVICSAITPAADPPTEPPP